MNAIERHQAERAARAENLSGDALQIFNALISDVYSEQRQFYGFQAAIADLNTQMARLPFQDWQAANRALHSVRLWEREHRYARDGATS